MEKKNPSKYEEHKNRRKLTRQAKIEKCDQLLKAGYSKLEIMAELGVTRESVNEYIRQKRDPIKFAQVRNQKRNADSGYAEGVTSKSRGRDVFVNIGEPIRNWLDDISMSSLKEALEEIRCSKRELFLKELKDPYY